jgi:hypothetical protein
MVAKRVSRRPLGDPGLSHRLLDRLLHLRFMQIIPPKLPRRRNARQLEGGEEPLPDEILHRMGVFLFQGVK